MMGSGGINEASEDIQPSETDSSECGAPQSKRRKLSSWLKETTQVSTASTSVTPQTAEQKMNNEVVDFI